MPTKVETKVEEPQRLRSCWYNQIIIILLLLFVRILRSCIPPCCILSHTQLRLAPNQALYVTSNINSSHGYSNKYGRENGRELEPQCAYLFTASREREREGEREENQWRSWNHTIIVRTYSNQLVSKKSRQKLKLYMHMPVAVMTGSGFVEVLNGWTTPNSRQYLPQVWFPDYHRSGS